MSSQAVMKRQILALAKREPSNEELQKIKQSLAVFKKLTKEEQEKINEMVTNAHAKLDSEGKFAKGGKTKTQSLKTALTEFKNKIGVKKFKRATTGTDIKKDIGRPALKVGKRIVRKKGKTTNLYGTFKNQVGTTYYEGRPNRSDVNQPSEKRKIKLADGGQTNESIEIGGFKRNIMGTLSFDLKLKKMRKSQDFIVYPAQEKSDYILIQSSTRFGKIEMTSGEGLMSQSHANGAYAYHFQADKKDKFQLSEEQLSQLKEELAKTAGKKVGSSVIFSDNSYADKFAKGGLTEHGLRLTDTIIEDFGDNEIGVRNANGDFHRVNLDEGKRFAKGGEVSQYIDGLSKQEVLSKSIVYDNGGESYDRYTIFTPDGSVYGMSETAEGFNQYIGDSSEIEKGKHLGRKLRSVPKSIQGAVLDRMLDDEQMFAKGGKLSKEDALEKAIEMGVDFNKDFHAQSVGNELAELAKESGYKKSPSSSGSTGRAFFYHLQKIYKKKKFADGGNVRDWSVSDVSDAKYLGVIEFQDNQEEYHNFEIMETEDRLVFGSFTNSGFMESGYIEKDGMSTDETLQNLLEDLEVYYNDGEQYTSMIVFNKRMANGGKLRSKAKYIPNRNIDEIEVTRNGKTTSIDGANLLDGVYVKKGTRYAKGGEIGQKVFEAKEDGILGIFSGSDSYSIQISKGDTFVTYGDQDNSNWWYVKKIDKKPSTMSLNNDFDYTKSKSRVKVNWDELILTFPKGDNMIYAQMQEIYAQGGTIKKSLAEFKNKVGASKYREATRGVDIKADLQIPALKKGRRVVTTKGKTSNQYGTFKNKVGSVYYENRPNHYDVNQPSEKRKIKLADGGQIKYVIINDNSDRIYFRSPQLDLVKLKLKEIQEIYPNEKIIIQKFANGGTFANGGVLEGAEIYVADLAEYNNGRLVGKHLKLSDYSSGAEVMEAIQAILDEQTAKDKYGEVHEEYAIHDFEGFPRSFYSESMGEKDFDKIYQIAEVANDRGIPIDVLMEAVADFGADEDQIERIAEAYYTSVPASMGNESRDFAYEYIDSIGSITDAVSNPDFYFDYESFGSDARMDYSDEDLEEYGYDELDDTELGERLVDDMGGFDQLGKETIESYFDYDRFGRDLEQDFISVKGDDGDYYFFNRNW